VGFRAFDLRPPYGGATAGRWLVFGAWVVWLAGGGGVVAVCGCVCLSWRISGRIVLAQRWGGTLPGMATKQVRVCDVCGELATTTRRLDVCGVHAGNAKPRPARKQAGLVACEVCGKKVRAGAGVALHMRQVHPGGK
jgi:ribosomal protein S14